MNNTIGFVKTSDFNLSSTLYCLGYNIDGIDKGDRKRVTFYFRRTSDLEKTLKEYWGHQIRIDPLDFERARREIEAQIRTEIDNEENFKEPI